MLKKIRFAVMCALPLLIWTSVAVADVRSDVAELMEHVRKHEVVDERVVRSLPPSQVVNELDRYRNPKLHPQENVRLKAIVLIRDIALKRGKPLLIKKAVTSLLDSAANEEEYAMRDYAVGQLLHFPESAFADEKFKEQVKEFVAVPDPSASVLRLAGISGGDNVKPLLQKLAEEPVDMTDEVWWARNPWIAHLALARLGDPVEIKYCIETVDKVKDASLRVTTLLRDLDYVRQPETVDVLIKYLMSDEILPGSPPDVPDNPYAGYAIFLLLDSIEGFPQINLKGDDRPDWLTEARAWVKANRETLKIKR